MVYGKFWESQSTQCDVVLKKDFPTNTKLYFPSKGLLIYVQISTQNCGAKTLTSSAGEYDPQSD